MPGSYVWEKVLGRVSLPVGKPGEVGPSIGNFEISLKEWSSYGASLYTGALLGEPGGGTPLLGTF
jgi:hypothetical protein